MHAPTHLPAFSHSVCAHLPPSRPTPPLRSQLIRRERECEIIDRKLVKEVLDIFVEMGGSRNSLEVYVTDFEDMLLSTTADFYSRESSKWAEEDSFPDYMCKAEDRL